jgi:hypothetical protein
MNGGSAAPLVMSLLRFQRRAQASRALSAEHRYCGNLRDPDPSGLASIRSMARTGQTSQAFSVFSVELDGKRFELLAELLPKASASVC